MKDPIITIMAAGPAINKPLLKGASFCMLAFAINTLNDVLAKSLGMDLHPVEVTFLRFLLSAVILLPLGFWKGWGLFRTQRPLLHGARGVLLFCGIGLWCHGLGHVPISLATTINFTIPLFTLLLARIFLKEHIGRARFLVTLGGFLGVLFVLHPEGDFDPAAISLLLASLLFAMLDILNKRFVVQESMVAMLFWGSVATALLGAFPATAVWATPSLPALGLFCLLGLGANGILFFLLKGFALADASALAPFRYVELVFAVGAGYFFFQETPSLWTLAGAAVIIPSTLFLGLLSKPINSDQKRKLI